MIDISKSFGATIALDKVNLNVSNREIHALVGENGAGKSTLMKILAGVHQPDQGIIKINDKKFRPRDPQEARRKGIGMIYQELTLIPHLTVEENIFLGIEPRSGPFIQKKVMRNRIKRIFEQLHQTKLKSDTLLKNLPISMQQVVEIARSLTLGSKIIIFDEPTSSLNQADTTKLFHLIRGLKEHGLSIIYISHFIEEVKEIADRITILRDGRLIGSFEKNNISEKKIVSMMVGRQISKLYTRSAREAKDEILNLENLQGIHTPKTASLHVSMGEIFGIFGLIGSGRSELLRAVFGLEKIKNGTIRFMAYSGYHPPRQRLEQGMGYLTENRKDEGIAAGMTLADNLTLSKLETVKRRGFLSRKRQSEIVDQWVHRFDIRCQNAQQNISDLSGGNQQKVVLARLMYHDVDLLLLDEPTRGIDIATKAKIYQILDEIVSTDLKKAIILVSSYLPEILGIADRIAVMCRGRLGHARPANDLNPDMLMQQATRQENIDAG